MKNPYALLVPLLVITVATAQVERRGDFLSYVDSMVAAMPSGSSQNTYQVPSSQYLDAWKVLVTNFFQRNDSLAAAQATSLSYRLVAFVDSSVGAWQSFQEYRILEKLPNSSNYWGTYALNVSPARPQLMLQAPHPLNDSRTGLQSAYVFRYNGARAFFLSGAYRCNSSQFSPCSGTTATCSAEPEPFRESDVAHSVTSPFYVATVAAEELFQPSVVQLHGFAKLAGDPDIIMSNSTALMPATDVAAQIRDALLTTDNTLTFQIAHLNLSWARLTGTTNVQGRMINGSLNPCIQPSPANRGRFFHVEQAYAGLRDNVNGWMKMATALSIVFTPTTVVSDEPSVPSGFHLYQNFPNPFNPSTTLSYRLPEEADIMLDVVDVTGRVVGTVVSGMRPAGEHVATWVGPGATGVYFARLRVRSTAGTFVQAAVRKLVLTR